MTRQIKKLTVFLGANPGNDPVYEHGARQLGEWIADHQLTLVYGGGKYGLMGTIAKTVLDHGGQVEGVITHELADRNVSMEGLTQMEVVDRRGQRKADLIDDGDAVLTFPGGIGTLEEFSTAASAINLGNDPKPVALFNLNHYYDPLKHALQAMVDAGFYGEEYFKALDFDDDMDRIYQYMLNYQAPALRTYR